MSKRPDSEYQIDGLGLWPIPKVYIDPVQLDVFVNSHGTDWCLWTAMPSVIGKIDKGYYRRPNQIDTISSNGFIYSIAGVFTAVLTSNTKAQSFGDMGGLMSQASARLIMPRFFNSTDNQNLDAGGRIYPCIGDRIYKNGAEKDCSMWVVNYQQVDYNFGQDSKTAYPVKQVIGLTDATGQNLIEGTDFEISPVGDIHWIPGGRNPGINPTTQTGLPFAIRYLYVPYYYVSALPHELRVTNVGNFIDNTNTTARLPYFVEVQREYLYVNQNNNEPRVNNPPSPTPTRDPVRPSEPISGHAPVQVNIWDIEAEPRDPNE